ncbi:HAUS augmin-like complex subunit 6, partial [Lamprotornis superbus]
MEKRRARQIFRMKQNDRNKNDTTERIQKVRSMWTLILEMLTSLKKEKEVVDSVLEDCVNPCILDGTDVVLSVPGLLTHTIESNKYGQLLKASSLQCFSSSDEDEDSVFDQSFSDNYDSCHEECHGKNDGALEDMKDTALNLHTCVGNKKSAPPKTLKKGKEEFPALEMEKNAGKNVTQPKSPVKKDDLLEKARDELAEEIAKSVCESPDSGEEKGMALDDLISSLSFNPFLTRKQIPRTPENLLTEIRSSWRKAIQTEASLELELSSTQVVTEESSMNATCIQEEVDSAFVMDGEKSTNDSENDEDIKKSDLDVQSLSNSHEVLKKTASKSEEKLRQILIQKELELVPLSRTRSKGTLDLLHPQSPCIQVFGFCPHFLCPSTQMVSPVFISFVIQK